MGSGRPAIVFLHGGWGYEVYPIDDQAEDLAAHHCVLIPDRSGYGQSTPIASLSVDFHRQAMLETFLFLDALHIDRAIWWGHSDGAVIAALAAIERPDHAAAVILEALHLCRREPHSTAFFEQMLTAPDSFGPRITATLARDHGDRWREVLRLGGRAWLEIGASAAGEHDDLFGQRLATQRPPAMLVHGGRDPRTEPGEFEAIRAALPQARLAHYPAAGHCPHAESATASLVTRDICAFVGTIPAS